MNVEMEAAWRSAIYNAEGAEKAEKELDSAKILIREILEWDEDLTVTIDWYGWRKNARNILGEGCYD